MLGTASAATTLSVQGKPLMSSRPERLRFWRVLVALGAGIIEARLRAFREIRRMSRREGNHQADDVGVAGKCRVTAGGRLGTVDGRWRLLRRGRELNVELFPDHGWTPGPAPRMARVLYRVVSTPVRLKRLARDPVRTLG